MHRFSQQEMTERASLYALGALSQWEARDFEEHLAGGCETCAAELRSFKEAARSIALSAPEAEPPARLRDELMTLVAEDKRTQAEASRQAETPPLITLRAHEGEWLKVGSGIKVKHLFTDPQTGMVTTLVKMKPGAQIPLHRHSGIEQCYVIEGDFHAANQELGAGDFHVATAGSTHEPVYTKGGALVLIVAPPGYEPLAQHQQ